MTFDVINLADPIRPGHFKDIAVGVFGQWLKKGCGIHGTDIHLAVYKRLSAMYIDSYGYHFLQQGIGCVS